MTNALIEVRNLSVNLGEKSVLKSLNLDVMEGKSLALIGGSGEGKSVLLKCILGLLNPDFGIIRYRGSELVGKNKNHFLSEFGMLFQGAALFDSLPVWENISFRYRQNYNFSTVKRKDLAIEKLSLVGMPESVAYLLPAELSGGMQKRVGIARAIATNPSILFFDEPTSGLDPIIAHTINKLIHQIVADLGATAVTITHDLKCIRTIADNVALLNNGSISWHGTINDFDLTKNLRIEKFRSPGTKSTNV